MRAQKKVKWRAPGYGREDKSQGWNETVGFTRNPGRGSNSVCVWRMVVMRAQVD